MLVFHLNFNSVYIIWMTISYKNALQELTLIARQETAFFLSAQVAGNSVWSLCICLTPVALGINHKLCITNIFHLKLISPAHSHGLFANRNNGMKEMWI